ncbi:MAG TPA: VOC family protein [Vicinamibacterales bacterium]|jgi:predicted 3-demethylubiquinone-9 3-methyltransferase (glyoxalase superfamily)
MHTPQIAPHLWFDTQAREAADWYASILPGSRVTHVAKIENTPSGEAHVVTFELAGQPFRAISAGPLFRFNPSISFLIACATKEEVDRLWTPFSQGGQVLMPLDSYPFSERYGWLQDRYGLSWQIMFMGDRTSPRTITPTLIFTGRVAGQAEEAITLYTSIFPESSIDHIDRWGTGDQPNRAGTVKHAGFRLAGQSFAAMDSAYDHTFAFNEAISLTVSCDTQDEIDHYWSQLSAVPQAEQCGWLKDRFGVSWQIVPGVLGEMMTRGSKDQVMRVTQAFLKMKKFDLAALERAYRG